MYIYIYLYKYVYIHLFCGFLNSFWMISINKTGCLGVLLSCPSDWDAMMDIICTGIHKYNLLMWCVFRGTSIFHDLDHTPYSLDFIFDLGEVFCFIFPLPVSLED